MEKETFGEKAAFEKQNDGGFTQDEENNKENILKDEQSSTVIEDKEKDVLENSENENYAEQTENLKSEDKENPQSQEEEEKDELSLLKIELEESKDKYIRLYSEFDNFRRRTAKERLELVKTANEDLIVNLLSVADDFNRASQAMENQEDIEAVKKGTALIQNKFFKVLEQKGLKPMGDLRGESFDADIHEAITQIPAPEDKLKGKIVDVIENGYYLNDKVIRYAKVVIGA